MKKGLLSFSLLFIMIIAAYTFIDEAADTIGRDYFDSDTFRSEYYDFQAGLEKYVLNEVDFEAAKKSLKVTADEIDKYRTYYGSLAEQIESVKSQYEGRIEKENEPDEDVRKALIAERDEKIKAIQDNFKDDEEVEKKILAIKERALENFVERQMEQRKQWQNQYSYFNYAFEAQDSGEKFSRGNMESKALFKQKFGENNTVFDDGNAVTSFYLNEYLIDSDVGIEAQEIYLPSKERHFTGTIMIPVSKLSAANFSTDYNAFKMKKIINYTLWALGVLALIGLYTVAKPSVQGFEKQRALFEKAPIDVRTAIWVLIIFITYIVILEVGYVLNKMSFITSNIYGSDIVGALFILGMAFIFVVAAIYTTYWLWQTFFHNKKLKEEWQQTYIKRIGSAVGQSFYNRKIGTQMLLMLVIIFFAGMGAVPALLDGMAFVLYVPFVLLILIPTLFVFIRRFGYLNQIIQSTESMSQGGVAKPIEVKGKSPLADHAKHLNTLQEGVRKSVLEQAKSERLKTELITNVSHDLRTPLTSIITYTELLKAPNLSEEERLKYASILDIKSTRLKVLIEDLFEVSKMASGNVELVRQKVDLAQMLQQVTGEYEQDIESSGLQLRVMIEEQPILAEVDAQKWHRVLDNALGNARKYALAGTRIYVTLEQRNKEAIFTFKNIANYEMNGDAEELKERFKRADASRHTEGSGLGLAIAQSIVDLHNGKMMIETDGDMFKLIISVSVY